MLHRISSTDNWDHEMKIPRALLLHSSIQPLPTRTSFECLTSAHKQRKGNDCSTWFFKQTTDILKWAHLGNCYYTPVCNHYHLLSANWCTKTKKRAWLFYRISSTDNWDCDMITPWALFLHSSISPLPTQMNVSIE